MNVYLEAYGVEPYSEKFLDLAIRESLSNERISLISLQKFHFKHSNVRFLLLSLFHPRTMNNKINCIHERALRLVYSGHIYSSDELLKKDRSFSIHNRNIQSLVKFTSFFTVFLQEPSKISSILTQVFHTTLGYAVNFIVEIQKQ